MVSIAAGVDLPNPHQASISRSRFRAALAKETIQVPLDDAQCDLRANKKL